MQKTSPAGRKFIEGFEGLFLQAYDDANDHIVQPGEPVHGTLTIGYGHTSAAGPPQVYVGQVIDEPTADAILAADLASVEIEVGHLVTVPLNQNQFDALVSFQFNTGWLAHPNCSLLAALNGGNYQLAANDFMLYDRASGQVLTGLVRRRVGERAMFLTPMAQEIT
jgi:lysozyme